MSDTINFDLQEGVWLDISSGLTDDTIYTIQNRNSGNVELIEKSTVPDSSNFNEGFFLAPKQFTLIKPVAGSVIYARSIYSVARVVIEEAV
jgi:hypothetical protein